MSDFALWSLSIFLALSALVGLYGLTDGRLRQALGIPVWLAFVALTTGTAMLLDMYR